MHGWKCISEHEALIINIPTEVYDYENPDEQRIPWNDPRIVPSEINGNKNDPRVNQPWDWFYPPYKNRHALASLSSNGYISPSASIYHPNLTLGKYIFLGDGVTIFGRGVNESVVLGDGKPV